MSEVIFNVLEITPLLFTLRILALSWLNTNKLGYNALVDKAGIFDNANTSAKSVTGNNEGSNKLIESTVVGEPFVAVPAVKSTPV
jgi:hypothetical protein